MADDNFSEMDLVAYLENGGATDRLIQDFSNWCEIMCGRIIGDADEKRRRYVCYKLWAKLLRMRRTPYPPGTRFVYDACLKDYLRHLTGGDIVDADPYDGAVYVGSVEFVKYVVKHLNDAL